MPRRIQTIHHHHHHVVLMDPDTKTMMMTKPYSAKPAATVSAEGYLQEVQARGHEYEQHEHQLHKRHRHHRQQQQQQHQHQQQADASHPLSYVEQRKTVPATVRQPRDHSAHASVVKTYSDFPYALVPASHGSVWRPVAPPVRDKRSRPRIFARLVTAYDD